MEKQKYNTVVMDGSSFPVVDDIKEMIDMMVGNRHGSFCTPIDNEHPTMILIETETTEDEYNQAADIIECLYPGLCTFNAPM